MKMKEKVVKAIKNNDSNITAKDGLLLFECRIQEMFVSHQIDIECLPYLP